MSRVETKYITVKKLNQNYFNLSRYFEQSYNDRKINNIYFDTLNDSLYMDHIEGSLVRHKVRVRWYEGIEKNFRQQPKDFYLEIKIKKNTKILKFKTKLKNFNNLNIDLSYINFEYLKLLSSENLKIKFSCLFPKIKNSYKRKYFIISKNPNNRLTLDYDLKFTNYYGNNLLSNTKFSTHFNILEHKYIENKNKHIQLNNLNFTKIGFSKYIYGYSKIKNHDFFTF